MLRSYRNIMSNWRFSYFRIGLFYLIISSFAITQDQPEEFDFNISIYQSFYFFLEATIDGDELEVGEDWIASFSVYDETKQGLCSYIGQFIEINENIQGNEVTIYECEDLNGDGQLTTDAEICVGSYYWEGEYTTVPVMGHDGTIWTKGYLVQDQIPIFKVYDFSEDTFYPAVPSMVYPPRSLKICVMVFNLGTPSIHCFFSLNCLSKRLNSKFSSAK